MTPASDAGSAAQGDQDTPAGKAPDAGRAAGGNVPGGPVPGSFAARHIGLDAPGRARVREVLGLAPAESAIGRALPAQLRSGLPEGLPEAADEATVLADLRRLAARNRGPKPMIGMGYYGTHLPAVIQRGILENPSWYTAYTPYQAEISQGRLEALFTFQTMIRDLTGLEMANASLLDEATAAAEAMTLCHRAARGKRARFAVDCDLFGQTRAVLANRAEPLGIELVDFDPAADPVPADVAGVLVQYQGADGRLLALAPLAQAAHAVGALLAVAADPLALTLLEAPGTLGADIAIGSVQRFGLPLGLGGPHAAYMAVRKGLERQMPGRLVGLSRDADGGPAFRLALQTREQHIRRERATSNICTAQVLVAVMAAMYAVWHGPAGLTQIALAVHAKARALVAALTAAGLELREGPSFDTVAVHTPGRSAAVRGAAQGLGIDVWAAGPDWVYLSTDETTTEDDLRKAAQAFGADPALIDPAAWRPAGGPSAAGGAASDLAAWERRTPFLTHRVFTEFHSETAMMRYLHRLAARDYALDRGMIPLGSCTMKLNAAAVMAAVTWPEFGAPHP
ncbi:MAG: hypothetical protein LBM66_01200, partial [Bifidobacteriaceae bacterium]|nr:hypothetical protein [Bifidobacteriaceae bacterium]